MSVREILDRQQIDSVCVGVRERESVSVSVKERQRERERERDGKKSSVKSVECGGKET